MGKRRSLPPREELPRWVLHHHRKPRDHRDLRLELDGVLASWAVPKGLPDDPRRNRLAVQVADHDLDHLTYTDEDKDIEDTGRFVLHERTPDKIVMTLGGRGGMTMYALIHTRGADWLLHRMAGPPG